MGKTEIVIDYDLCGDGEGAVDPRTCSRCLQVCDPAIFLKHGPVGLEQDPVDPQVWRITAVWKSLCSRCMKCVEECPQKAIEVTW